MSADVATPQTPAEQVFTITEAPSPDNAARFYPSCENATLEELEQMKQKYAASLLRFHKTMAGPEVNKGTAGLKTETEPRRGSTGSDSSTDSSEGHIN